MTDAIYEIRNLRHRHQDQPVLELDHLTIEPESIVGLIGPNGSGKSTLLALLAGASLPTEGQIRFKNHPLKPFSDISRFHIALLPQEPYLLKRKVFHNVAYGLSLRKTNRNPEDAVRDAMGLVGLDPEEFCQRQHHELSGGEARRVALAARLALRTEVLLLDEPTSGVDAASVQRIKDAVHSAREQWGASLVIASHDWEWLEQVCDRVLHLYKGRIVGEGRTNLIFGPWRSRKDGLWEKALHDGQLFLTVRPPHPEACALLDHRTLTVQSFPQEDLAGKYTLQAFIRNMTLEPGTTALHLTLTAGGLDWHASIDSRTAAAARLLPGKKIHLSYDPRTIRWL
ncbi:MAG: energy-coupling factor ABC transporter ATP-binding protein [Thermodesulfobacteriota bacterium]